VVDWKRQDISRGNPTDGVSPQEHEAAATLQALGEVRVALEQKFGGSSPLASEGDGRDSAVGRASRVPLPSSSLCACSPRPLHPAGAPPRMLTRHVPAHVLRRCGNFDHHGRGCAPRSTHAPQCFDQFQCFNVPMFSQRRRSISAWARVSARQWLASMPLLTPRRAAELGGLRYTGLTAAAAAAEHPRQDGQPGEHGAAPRRRGRKACPPPPPRNGGVPRGSC
jgi:hypothetical protein